jgi:hypothetical protein
MMTWDSDSLIRRWSLLAIDTGDVLVRVPFGRFVSLSLSLLRDWLKLATDELRPRGNTSNHSTTHSIKYCFPPSHTRTQKCA